MSIDWKKILKEPKIYQRFEYLAQKKFHWDDDLKDEAYNFALDKISNVVKGKNSDVNEGSAENYLCTIFLRALYDFSRSKRRIRPNTAIKNLGENAVAIWKMLCYKRLLVDEIKKYPVKDKDGVMLRLSEIERLINEIRKLDKNCGIFDAIAVEFTAYEQIGEIRTSGIIASGAEQASKSVIDIVIDECNIESSEKMQRVFTKIKRKLSADDYLLLKMKIIEEQSNPVIANALDITPYKLKKRLSEIIEILTQMFEKEGR